MIFNNKKNENPVGWEAGHVLEYHVFEGHIFEWQVLEKLLVRKVVWIK
jgi:hypothetical protein